MKSKHRTYAQENSCRYCGNCYRIDNICHKSTITAPDPSGY